MWQSAKYVTIASSCFSDMPNQFLAPGETHTHTHTNTQTHKAKPIHPRYAGCNKPKDTKPPKQKKLKPGLITLYDMDMATKQIRPFSQLCGPHLEHAILQLLQGLLKSFYYEYQLSNTKNDDYPIID